MVWSPIQRAVFRPFLTEKCSHGDRRKVGSEEEREKNGPRRRNLSLYFGNIKMLRVDVRGLQKFYFFLFSFSKRMLVSSYEWVHSRNTKEFFLTCFRKSILYLTASCMHDVLNRQRGCQLRWICFTFNWPSLPIWTFLSLHSVTFHTIDTHYESKHRSIWSVMHL